MTEERVAELWTAASGRPLVKGSVAHVFANSLIKELATPPAAALAPVATEDEMFDAYMDEPCALGSPVSRRSMFRNGTAVQLVREGWILRAKRIAAPTPSAPAPTSSCPECVGRGTYDVENNPVCTRCNGMGRLNVLSGIASQIADTLLGSPSTDDHAYVLGMLQQITSSTPAPVAIYQVMTEENTWEDVDWMTYVSTDSDKQIVYAAPLPQPEVGDLRDAEIARLNAIINTPHTDDFIRAVSIEAEHQRQRWSADDDAGKTPADWFWLVGYLAGKALHSHAADNLQKGEHHIITTAAACANWHLAMFGKTDMRPGHAEGLDGLLASPPTPKDQVADKGVA